MARFRIDSIAELARQLPFAPREVRQQQIESAETLLLELQPSKAYPRSFVVFRVTGYHPRGAAEDELLTGLALQHDLGLLIEQISDTLDVHSADLPEPVLQIDDVCERFNVTSKTIQRWRRKGLPARRFVFPDGKRRVGFLLGSVERFLSTHEVEVARGARFSQVDDDERAQILRRARRLALQCHCCINEICRRVGRKVGRSPLTILHTIRKHDAEHPSDAVFADAGEEIAPEQRRQIVRAYRRGVHLRVLSRRVCRPRSAVYRVVVDERWQRLSTRKVKFIDDPLYHQPDATSLIDSLVSAQRQALGDSPVDNRRELSAMPLYLRELCRTAPLSAGMERALFLKLNFHKYQFASARRRVEPLAVRARDLDRLEAILRQVSETKNDILRANLRLVVSIARKHVRGSVGLAELISEGTLTLMRAIDGFDVHRGHKFSTYATLALMKGFARSVPQMLAAERKSQGEPELVAGLVDRRSPGVDEALVRRDHVARLLSRLEPRERDVLIAHYGLTGEAPADSVAQLGQRLQLSPQRVRQLERSAIQKLRAQN